MWVFFLHWKSKHLVSRKAPNHPNPNDLLDAPLDVWKNIYYTHPCVIQDLFIGQDQLTSTRLKATVYISTCSHPSRYSPRWILVGLDIYKSYSSPPRDITNNNFPLSILGMWHNYLCRVWSVPKRAWPLHHSTLLGAHTLGVRTMEPRGWQHNRAPR